jgi:hypothetical protein
MAENDQSNADFTAKLIVNKYTDDGMLAPNEDQWNNRFHNIPSKWNDTNHAHYRQFFDKQFRQPQSNAIRPKRELDPYEQNEFKGTRMPDYSKVSKERDIYGELGWIPNFNVKCSKDNDLRHSTTREYFDQPMNYHATFNKSSMTNSEFFRQNAPHHSVAKERVQTVSVFNKSQMGSTMRSTQSTFQTSLYATPFVLERDVSNKYRNTNTIKQTQTQPNSIPFLRCPHLEWKQVQSNSPVRNKQRK